jgi:hypothetical protein
MLEQPHTPLPPLAVFFDLANPTIVGAAGKPNETAELQQGLDLIRSLPQSFPKPFPNGLVSCPLKPRRTQFFKDLECFLVAAARGVRAHLRHLLPLDGDCEALTLAHVLDDLEIPRFQIFKTDFSQQEPSIAFPFATSLIGGIRPRHTPPPSHHSRASLE